MSLQIWLPLNGNLDNQGLTELSITNTGVSANTAGKIGSCMAFDSSSSYLKTVYPASNYTKKPFSVAFWAYFNSVSSNGCVCTGRTGVGYGFSIFRIGNTIRFDNGSNSEGSPCSFGYTLNANKWYHIACVQTETNRLLYVDGVLVGNGAFRPHTGTNGALNFLIGASGSSDSGMATGNYLNGRLNDFRLYDHALSAKEVRELAKGLVLHYKLDDVTTATSLVDKTANYTIYNNYGVPASLVATDETYLGSPVRRLTMTPTEARLSNFRTSLANHGVYNWRQTFLADTKYAFWIYYRPVTHNDVRVGGTASNISGWREIAPQYVGGGWYVVGQYRNGTVTSDKTDNIFVSFYTPTAEADVPISIDFACPTLVKDTIEIQPELNYRERHDIVYDSSGFGYNGTPANVETLSDSPRYLKSTHFTGSTSKIHIPNLSTTGFSSTYSFAWWGKTNSLSSKMFWGFQNGTRLNLYNGIYWNTGDGSSDPIYIPGTATTITAPSLNVWHHYVMTCDGTSCLLYLDGVLYGQAKTVKSITGTDIWFNGWDSGSSYTLTDMSIADFRMYSTALSADDILELYHTSASIDKSGSIYARELVE